MLQGRGKGNTVERPVRPPFLEIRKGWGTQVVFEMPGYCDLAGGVAGFLVVVAGFFAGAAAAG